MEIGYHLGFSLKSTKRTIWMPLSFITKYHKQGESLLHQVVTCNETWWNMGVSFYTTESKCSSMERGEKGGRPPKKSRTVFSACKFLAQLSFGTTQVFYWLTVLKKENLLMQRTTVTFWTVWERPWRTRGQIYWRIKECFSFMKRTVTFCAPNIWKIIKIRMASVWASFIIARLSVEGRSSFPRDETRI